MASNARHIAIFAPYKSGSTALFFLIRAALAANTRELFEATRYAPEADDATRDLLAKVILGVNQGQELADYASFSGFHQSVLLVRDPRDWLVSGTLFLIQTHASLYADDARMSHLLAVLRRKEADPGAVPLRELLGTVLDAIPGQNLHANRAWLVEQHRWMLDFPQRLGAFHRLKYEDLVDGKIAPLAAALGLVLHPASDVPAAFDHVVRSKSHGQWRHWFTPEDLSWFQPPFQDYLAHHGYPDGDLAMRQVIAAEHGSDYVLRVVNKRRAAHQPPLPPLG
jgi:hypothetical protein